MRKVAAAFILSALVAPVDAQRAALRWEPTGGPLVGQQKQIIAQRGRLLLVGADGVQWWRSADRGMSWEASGDPRTRPRVVGANDRNLFGDAIDGVLRSSDMGESWTRCGALPVNRRIGNDVTSIAADERRVYVSLSRVGLFRSEDQCATWMQLETPWKFELPPVITYANGSRVIVRAFRGSFLSIDAGNTWTVLDDRVPDALAFTTGCKGMILAGTGRGALASRDDGRSWTSIRLPGSWIPAIAAPRCGEMFAVVRDSERWTHSVFRSIDGGARWAFANTGLSGHPIISFTMDDQGAVYAAGSSGAFRWSQNEWQQIGPADTTITSVVGAPWGDVFAAAGWMGLFRSKEAAEPWQRLLLGHDAHVSSHEPSDDAASVITVTLKGDLFAAYERQQGVLRSRDRGQTWRRMGLAHTVHSFVSTRSGALLSGTDNGIFRSVDDGESWIERSIGLSAFRIYSLAVAADGTVYAAAWEGGVFRSTDEGDRWRPMSGPRRGRALVALRNGDLLAASHSELSRWSAAAQSWQPIALTTERRTSAVRALMQDFRGYVFAGTEGDGVFASFDEGMTWQAANEGLTANRVFSFAVDSKGHVVSGTSAGVFRASLNAGAFPFPFSFSLLPFPFSLF